MTHPKENHDFDQAFPTFMIMALFSEGVLVESTGAISVQECFMETVL